MRLCFAIFALCVLPVCAHSQVRPVAVGPNRYAFELFQMFRQMTKGNFCFSPYSSHRVAALLVEGAKGETQKQILGMTHLPADAAARAAQAAELRKELSNSDPVLILDVANSLWAPSGSQILPSFQATARANFGAAVESLPLGDPVSSSVIVNKWIRDQTRGRISSMVGPSSFQFPNTVLAVNAVYLKASWQSSFDIKQTQARDFVLQSQNTIKLMTMMQTADAISGTHYGESSAWQCLEMPMDGGRASMLFLLPRQETERTAIESGLDSETWGKVTRSLGAEVVDKIRIQFPRFSYSTQLDLSGLWQSAGVRDVFDSNKADLTGMMAGRYRISGVLHETTIDVNELGADASAATLVSADPFGDAPDVPKPPPPRIVSFIANRPFVWIIQHRTTGLILFMGRFAGE